VVYSLYFSKVRVIIKLWNGTIMLASTFLAIMNRKDFKINQIVDKV